MIDIKDELDWQIYFSNNDEPACPYVWTETNEPLTFRSAYERLKLLLDTDNDTDNVEILRKSEFRQGHRKKMFNHQDINEIKKMHKNGISKNKIAKNFKCSEKTIRNYLKNSK